MTTGIVMKRQVPMTPLMQASYDNWRKYMEGQGYKVEDDGVQVGTMTAWAVKEQTNTPVAA